MPSDLHPFKKTVEDMRAMITGGGGPPAPPLPPRERGDDPHMEARLKRLEDDFRAIRGDLTTINGRLGSVEGKLDLLTNQVVSKIPSGWTMFSVIVGTLGASVALLTAAAAAAKWLGFLPR